MIEELNRICNVEKNVNLVNYNTYKLNSICDYFVKVNNEEDLINIIKILKVNDTKYFILGGGSNVIIPSSYNGVVVKLAFNNYEINNDILYAESGCMINKLGIETAKMGYSGIDALSGVPGSIGGSVYGNAGCYGVSISDSLIDVRVFDGEKIITLTNEDCDFGYRTSIFKKNKNYIILSARFKLSKGDKEEIMNLICERSEKRRISQPLEYPSCGSVFRNPEGLVAGKLIDEAGLKGMHIGGAYVSEKHANFIVNKDNATYEDIVSLIELIKKTIKEKNSIDLVLEQEIIK